MELVTQSVPHELHSSALVFVKTVDTTINRNKTRDIALKR
jgi:hypothetical protein